MLDAAGLGFLRQDWLGDPKIALLSVGAVIIWREAVLGVILFVARLLSLSTEPLRRRWSAGASRWRAHWSVTLPQMRGIIGFYAITSVITVAVWTFSYVFVMTNGGPGNATMTADLYIYQNAFRSADEPRRLRRHPRPHRRHRGGRRVGPASEIEAHIMSTVGQSAWRGSSCLSHPPPDFGLAAYCNRPS